MTYISNCYVIDWDKVKTQDDIITILKGLSVQFAYPSEELKKLCIYVDKGTGKQIKIK